MQYSTGNYADLYSLLLFEKFLNVSVMYWITAHTYLVYKKTRKEPVDKATKSLK